MTCYQCKARPARKGQRTCSSCWAAYIRTYRARARKSRDLKAYNRGIEALRVLLSDVFKTIGAAELSGYTALEIVANSAAKVPRGTFT